MAYGISKFEIIKTETFERWLLGLKDRMARARVQARPAGHRAPGGR
jgi:putative component of toxin-antitoxin plasmid stabilization module